MKKALIRNKKPYWYWKNDEQIFDAPDNVSGNLTGISGDLTGICGDLTGIRGNLIDIRGDLTGIRGNLTGIRGDLTGISGDLDDCDISDADRKKGINIDDLLKD